ncbi:hypothetical protein LTR78_005913 [Recurvomyces mirabilis]|uniref:Uncharacterized protein n=1 Tax=Recurvomyces mirabilis TaxID=574656 RepID=A0AAE1C0P9_9PEZI|nr:hypothetical protein LTR78_005913 [Recurvomyces mirabilis]KAK5155277.1 hypothetical protein LTS14_006232 [Recurvomyces mirabilis]
MTGSKVLVYHYRHEGSPLVKGGLAVVDQRELDGILEKHPEIQMSSKSIARGVMTVDVHQRDLLTNEQSEGIGSYPNRDVNLAGVKLPVTVVLSSVLSGNHKKMIILSKKL